ARLGVAPAPPLRPGAVHHLRGGPAHRGGDRREWPWRAPAHRFRAHQEGDHDRCRWPPHGRSRARHAPVAPLLGRTHPLRRPHRRPGPTAGPWQEEPDHRANRRPPVITLPPRPWLVAGSVSIAATAVGTLWLLRPQEYPYGPHSTVRTGLNALLPASAGAVALLALGVLGIALLLWKCTGGRAAIGAAILAAGFAVVLGDTSLFSSLGYFVGLLLPFVSLTLLVVLTRARSRTGGPVLLLALVGTVALWLSGQLPSLLTLYGSYVRNTIGSLGHYLSPIAWSWAMAAAAACWC